MKIHTDTINEFLENSRIKPLKKNKDGTHKWSLKIPQVNKMLDLYLKKHYLLNKAMFLKLINETNKVNKPLAEKFTEFYNKIIK